MSDPCECLFSHEALMRRLLSALRESQADCTDVECEDPSGTGTGGGGINLPIMLTLWGIAALVLFLTRPQSMRMPGNVPEKPRGSINREDDNPPAPDVQ